MKTITHIWLASLLCLVSVLVCVPTVAAGQAAFPREKLAQRLQAIERLKKVQISFDEHMVARATAPGLEVKGKTAETLIAQSVTPAGLGYKKYGATRFAITASVAAPVKRVAQAAVIPSKGSGTLKGTVLDTHNQPVIGATIMVGGTRLGAASDVNGAFTIAGVPAGSFTVEVSCMSYAKLKVSDVKIQSGRTTPLNVVLEEDVHQLQGVTVTATYNKASATGLYAKQKSVAAMTDGLSADLIKKTGDNNVAQVLGRVAGVAVTGGKFITVRGMGERYNNVELNGASLPSTEPNRRNFSFDVIPSALVDNVVVSKTFTPDMPGEFTGGLVQVQTLAVPDTRFFNVSVGTGINTMSIGRKAMGGRRYKGDYLFGDINSRKWYAGKDEAAQGVSAKNAGRINDYDFRRFVNRPLQNYSVVAGLPFDLGADHKLGAVLALTYRNEQTSDKIVEGRLYNMDRYTQPSWRNRFITSSGAVANIGWSWNGQKITWRNLYNSRLTHTTSERYLWKDYNGLSEYELYSTPLVSHLAQTQLDGEHLLTQGGTKLTWTASVNRATRTNPDDRMDIGGFAYQNADFVPKRGSNGEPLVSWGGGVTSSNQYDINGGFIMYSGNTEIKKTLAANLEVPFIVGGDKQVVKLGYAGTFRNAWYEQQYFKALAGPNYVAGGSEYNIAQFYDPQRFESGILRYVPAGIRGTAADYYSGRQRIHAAYVMGELSFFQRLKVITGVRLEAGKTQTRTEFWERNQQSYVDSLLQINKTELLPAATLIYNVTDRFNVRFAYSKTLARPDFRELSPSTYYNVDDRMYMSNGDVVKQTTTHNLDARVEWYPAPGEVVSFSAFFKEFNNPVELLTSLNMDGHNYDGHTVNLTKAYVRGLELNFRKGLGFIAPATPLKNLYVSGNFTLVNGSVTFNPDDFDYTRIGDATRTRPLQGLTPYALNTALTYDGGWISGAVNFSRTGRRLILAGTSKGTDQYENPRNVLDVQLSMRFFKKRLEVKINATDLLHNDYINYMNQHYDPTTQKRDERTDHMDYTDGDWILTRIKRGMGLTMSVSYKL